MRLEAEASDGDGRRSDLSKKRKGISVAGEGLDRKIDASPSTHRACNSSRSGQPRPVPSPGAASSSTTEIDSAKEKFVVSCVDDEEGTTFRGNEEENASTAKRRRRELILDGR